MQTAEQLKASSPHDPLVGVAVDVFAALAAALVIFTLLRRSARAEG